MTYRFCSRLAVAAAAALLAGVSGAFAAHDGPLVVARDGAAYAISFESVVDAAPRQVYAVLSDYVRLGELSPAIVSVRVMPAPGGRGVRVRSVLKSCVWVFCRSVVEVQDVVEPDGRTIVGRIVPGLGDFERGWTVWRVAALGGRTRVRYEASFVPAFWVPPLIGPWALERSLRADFESSMPALERLARGKGRDSRPGG
jgi:Polyketide cyclase / dehydrase and lipid transport